MNRLATWMGLLALTASAACESRVETGARTDEQVASALSTAVVCGSAAQNKTLSLACPAGQTITSITFASFGTPKGTCGAYTLGSCNSTNSKSIVSTACLGKASCSVPSTTTAFGGNPCPGTSKTLDVQVLCAAPAVDAGAPQDAHADARADAGADAGSHPSSDAASDAAGVVAPPPGPVGTVYTPPTAPRADVDLSPGWKFVKSDVSGASAVTFNDAAWTSLDLPHTWNNLDGQDGPDSSGNANYYRGIGWYRRHYTVPATMAGQKLYLDFKGANIVTDVYFNGTLVGEHQGGFAEFRYDVTSLAHVGADNVIAVKVNNAFNASVAPLNADFTFFGGLYRPVHFLATDPLAINPLDYASSGIFLKQTNVSAASATVAATVELANGNAAGKTATVYAVVVDASNTIVQVLTTSQAVGGASTAEAVMTSQLATPHLWNGRADPYMYQVYVEVRDGGRVTDVLGQPLGLRSFAVDPNAGFSLNGQYLDLHGVNKHQDRLDKGWAISDADVDEDMGLVMSIGATAIRLCHYQHSQHTYDAADRDGLVVWAEVPNIDYITNSTAFTNNAKQQLTELIRQNYNHPSIVFWSVANEITVDAGPDTNALLTTLLSLAQTEDATRIATLASAADYQDATTMHATTMGFNKYFGWYYQNLASFAPWADTAHAARPTTNFGVSEYGAGGSVNIHSTNPLACDGTNGTNCNHCEEYQCIFHETYWNAMRTRPFLWGKFVWNMFDFASDSRNEGDTPGRNDKGLMTYDRQTRKDAFYWYVANWTTAPMVYITDKRFATLPAATTSLKVYSNTPAVSLTVNGALVPSASSGNDTFAFQNIPWQTGTNTVVATGTQSDGTQVTDTATWSLAAPPPAPSGLTATATSSTSVALAWSTSPTPTSGLTYSVFRAMTPSFTPSSSNQIASNLPGLSYTDSSAQGGATYTYAVEAVLAGVSSAPSNQASATTPAGGPLQINCGGAAVAPFVADKDFTGGATISHPTNTIDLSGVTNPAPAAVYQTARDANFTYTVTGYAPASTHTLRLHFAETYFSSAGARVFNVSINGTKVLSNFDIWATTKAENKALVESFTQAADANGTYTLVFTSVVNNSLLSALEIQ